MIINIEGKWNNAHLLEFAEGWQEAIEDVSTATRVTIPT